MAESFSVAAADEGGGEFPLGQEEFNIASAVVLVRPERLAEVRAALLSLPGVEVHAVAPEGRMVITVEGERHRPVADTLTAFSQLDGVLSVDLIYQHSEPVNGPDLLSS